MESYTIAPMNDPERRDLLEFSPNDSRVQQTICGTKYANPQNTEKRERLLPEKDRLGLNQVKYVDGSAVFFLEELQEVGCDLNVITIV